ncbi:MAG: ferrochelatase, partial [Pyrinomonadaceae bacterium]
MAERPNLQGIEVKRIADYHDFEPYLDAVIERIEQGLQRFPSEKRNEVHLIFSAHGTPMKLVREGDPYSHQVRRTVEAVMKRAGFVQKYHLCFQSKVGPQKWLTPATPDTIEELASQGVKNMLVVPIAFVSDHLETLFEIGIEYARLAKEKGVEQFEVTEGLNDSEKFSEALAKLVLNQVKDSKNKH